MVEPPTGRIPTSVGIAPQRRYHEEVNFPHEAAHGPTFPRP
jgi:hypothetical protein